MKKFYLLAVAILLSVSILNAQKVIVVDDDNNGDEFEVIVTALVNGGYIVDSINLENADTLTYADLQNYDMVLWTTGDDRVALNLWDTTSGNVQFNPALQQYYDNKDGAIWLDGLCFVKPLVVPTDGSSTDNDTVASLLPVNFSSGNFVHDVLGITSWVYESKSMGDDGVPQFDKTTENTITNLNPIKWQYSTLWRADAWEIMPEATPLYVMGPASYAGAGHTSFYKYVNNGVTLYVSSVRLGRVGDGSAFSQTNLDYLVASIVNDAPAAVNAIEQNNIKIYPVPADDYININGVDNAKVIISDIAGRTVVSQNISNNATINISNLQAGVYNLVIVSENNTLSQKIIVK
jgi:hypothetical protein